MMNWFLSFYKLAQHHDLSEDEIIQLLKACNDLIGENGEIPKLKKIFPSALFQSTLRSDEFRKTGPKLAFSIKRKDVNAAFKQLQEYTTRNGVEVSGFVSENHQLYKLDEDNSYMRAEGEFWYMSEQGPFFESGENIVYLIHTNTVENSLNPELIWRRYKNRPNIINAMSLAQQEDEWDNARKFFRPEFFNNDYERSKFVQSFAKIYYKERPDQFRQNLEKVFTEFAKQVKNNPVSDYEYNITMNPNQEGKGKYISSKLIKEAYAKWGDFKVCVRYHAGRIIYNASEIVKFLSASIDDLDAEEFHNQLNGIRDFFVV